MKRLLFALFTVLLASSSLVLAQDGETLFKTYCSICHTNTADRLIGPGLAGVGERRTPDWFNRFVKSSKSLVDSGDPAAVAIFEEYSGIVMPDQNLTDAEISAIWTYLSGQAETPEVDVAPSEPDSTLLLAVAPEYNPSDWEIRRGERLFNGRLAFQNGGATCNSCHNIANGSMISGGSFAVDLTDAFTRLTKPGVEAVMSGLPFPAMKATYEDHVLTPDEIGAVTAFLKNASDNTPMQESGGILGFLLLSGIGGALVLMLAFSGIWHGRKSFTVNRGIYDRQIRSIN